MDGGVNWHWGNKGFNIKRCHYLTWFLPFGVDLLDKMSGVFEVVGRLANQWFDDVCQLLCHPICHGTPTGHYGLMGVPTLCIWVGHETWGDSTCGIQFPVLWVTDSTSLFMSLNVCTSIFFILDVQVHFLVSVQMGVPKHPLLPYTPSYVPPLFLIQQCHLGMFASFYYLV